MIGASAITRGGLPQGFAFGQQSGCEAIQLYVCPSRTWLARPLADQDVASFSTAWQASNVDAVIAHGSLLLNLASPHHELRTKSVDHLVVETTQARQLGIDRIVVHPGSNADHTAGINLIVQSINEVIAQTSGVTILVETMAGQGNCIGATFEELAAIMARVRDPARVGTCFDTCHVFAAGYDLRGYDGFQRVMDTFHDVVGIESIGALHVNDSLRPIGSRVDRHARLIGQGAIGLQTFQAVVQDRRFANTPLVAEVPDGAMFTKANIDLLKRLRGHVGPLPDGSSLD